MAYNPTSKYPAFMNVNTAEEEHLQRLAKQDKNQIFAAGLFLDHKFNALLVLDNQDGHGRKIWHKIPGGTCPNDVSKDSIYFDSLKKELVKMKYRNSIVEEILRQEEKKAPSRSISQRVMILEMVEETGYFPTNFSFGMDGFRFNTISKEYDLLQVFYNVLSIISPNSKFLKEGIKNIAQVRTTEAIDLDVKDMRVTVSIEKLIEKLGPATHKEAAKKLCEKNAAYWLERSTNEEDSKKGEFFMKISKRFAFQSM